MQLPNFDHTRFARIAGATAVAVLAAGWLAWAQVGTTGIIFGCVSASGQIRGIDETTGQCRAADQTLAWYTKQGADAMFLGREATATNADTLDGLDSTAFAVSGHRHDDLYLPLDAAGNFLTANGKAVDADLLDGVDSTQFVRITDVAELNATIAALTARIATLEGGSGDGGSGEETPPPTCDANPDCTTDPIDVVFLVDATGSMTGEITNLKNSLHTLISTQLTDRPNTQFAVAQFRDFPVAGYGFAGDQPFTLLQSLTSNTVLVQTAVNSLQASGGGEELPDLESGHEALYQTATTIGFRAGSKRLIIVITDAGFHNDYTFDFHDEFEALQALAAAGAKVIGVAADVAARDALRPYSIATGAVVTTATFGTLGGCGTGINGTQVAPVADGSCPLVFQIAADGSGLNTAIVSAVALVP